MPKGIKGFQKNNSGRPLGSKNKITLLKQERRAIFDERISQKWEKVIDELRAEYIADQFMGKAPDELTIKGDIKIDFDIADKNAIASSPKNNS